MWRSPSRRDGRSAPWSPLREAYHGGGIACSPSSGFHHACYDSNHGFCTFNGLVVAARKVLDLPGVERVGILDCDWHFGDGTQNIIQQLKLSDRIDHYTSGQHWHTEVAAYFDWLEEAVQQLVDNDVSLVLYQAGADAHKRDPLGGLLDDDQLLERDTLVFELYRKYHIPIAWNLAGGYRRRRRKYRTRLSYPPQHNVRCGHGCQCLNGVPCLSLPFCISGIAADFDSLGWRATSPGELNATPGQSSPKPPVQFASRPRIGFDQRVRRMRGRNVTRTRRWKTLRGVASRMSQGCSLSIFQSAPVYRRSGAWGLGIDPLSKGCNSRPHSGSSRIPRVPLRSTLGNPNPQLRS